MHIFTSFNLGRGGGDTGGRGCKPPSSLELGGGHKI